jgi:hypothetical protein
VVAGVNRDPLVRYSPIGQSHWRNPPPISLPAVNLPQRACNGCHEISETDLNYCRILRQAVERTMPPGGPYANWFMPSGSAFSTHIDALRGRCP